MNEKYVVAISFANYLNDKTGIPKVMLAHQQMFNNNSISYVTLFSVKKNICHDKIMLFCKFGLIIDGEYQGIYQMSQITNMFSEWNKEGKRLMDIHIHHLMYMKLNLVNELLDACVNVPIKVYLHDYYNACICYNLMRDGEFCGGKGLKPEFCENCEFYKKSLIIQDKIHRLFGNYLERILFISPSKNTKDIFLRFHPEYTEQTIVIAHQIYKDFYRENLEHIEKEEMIRVAYLGMPQMHKGWETWKKLVGCTKKNSYEFTVFNSTDEQYPLMNKRKVSFSQSNLDAMTDALRDYKVHIAVLWSKCAETYSYTCFEAFSANAFIITNEKSGNIADVVQKNKNGVVLKTDEELIDFFADKENVRKIINDFREKTVGGPEQLFENEKIVQLSLANNAQISIKKKNKLVNYPLIWLLNVIYRK